MSTIVSFLSIVHHWYGMLDGAERAKFREAVDTSWEEGKRAERLGKRFGELLLRAQSSLAKQVGGFLERCAKDSRVAANADFSRMSAETRRQAFEKSITGVGLIARDQLAAERRRDVYDLVVDWNDPAGAARWGQQETEREFKFQNAAKFAAKNLAGMQAGLAALIGELLTADFRAGTLELTGLRKVKQTGNLCVYEWESKPLECEDPQATVDGDTVNPLSKGSEAALFAWLRDERKLADFEIRKLQNSRPLVQLWSESMQSVRSAAKSLNPEIVDQVTKFLDLCLCYARGDRRRIAEEIALTTFHVLVVHYGDPRAGRLSQVTAQAALESNDWFAHAEKELEKLKAVAGDAKESSKLLKSFA
jgi:hypothetical protein